MAQGKEKANPQEIAERLDKLRDFLPSAITTIAKAWPEGPKIGPFNQDKFIGTALQCLQRQPRLLQKNADAWSLVGALRECIEYGLYPDDLRGYFYLTPRWDKDLSAWRAVAILGYRGFVYLFRRSAMAADGNAVQSERVYEGDVFEVEKGLEQKLIWRPDLKLAETPDRPLKLVYSILRYKDGTADFDFTMKWQIDQIRNFHSDAASSSFSPWNSKSDLVRSWMEKKTSLKQTLKLSPALDDVMAAAVSVDDLGDISIDQGLGGRLDKKLRDSIATMFSEGNPQVGVDTAPEAGKVARKPEGAIAGRTLGALMEKQKAAEPKVEPEAAKAADKAPEAAEGPKAAEVVEKEAEKAPEAPPQGVDDDGQPNPPEYVACVKCEQKVEAEHFTKHVAHCEGQKKRRGRPPGAKNKSKPSVSAPEAPPEPEAGDPGTEGATVVEPDSTTKAAIAAGDTDPDEPLDPESAWDDLAAATE